MREASEKVAKKDRSRSSMVHRLSEAFVLKTEEREEKAERSSLSGKSWNSMASYEVVCCSCCTTGLLSISVCKA